ncbi:hypothetical protein [Rhizobium sp. BK176]|uniref:hypothetical protein n=1 Tax=Rhizobium sp. BK176 TaxID=2587071 RepID=UPI002168B6B2|nr:hypothetical protein [Rhizobium sp. BK176]MCS4088466.1 hypothetical protein [Rhizobium sp. BK176]
MKTAKVRKAADAVRKRLEAEKNNAKIDAVFRKITKRVLRETSDRVLVTPAIFHDVGGFGKRFLDGESSVRTFEALYASHVAYGTDDSADYILAEVARLEDGFPCMINCHSYLFHCGDAEGLYRALKTMLSLKSTAAAFEELMDDDRRGSDPDRCRRPS